MGVAVGVGVFGGTVGVPLETEGTALWVASAVKVRLGVADAVIGGVPLVVDGVKFAVGVNVSVGVPVIVVVEVMVGVPVIVGVFVIVGVPVMVGVLVWVGGVAVPDGVGVVVRSLIGS